jgi:hypothetical protein
VIVPRGVVVGEELAAELARVIDVAVAAGHEPSRELARVLEDLRQLARPEPEGAGDGPPSIY